MARSSTFQNWRGVSLGLYGLEGQGSQGGRCLLSGPRSLAQLLAFYLECCRWVGLRGLMIRFAN